MRALFGSALVGTAAALGLALSSLGAPVLVAYLALLLVAVVALVRTVLRQRPAADGRTCTCCTSTVHDPVEVR